MCPADFGGKACIYYIPGRPAGPGSNDITIPKKIGKCIFSKLNAFASELHTYQGCIEAREDFQCFGRNGGNGRQTGGREAPPPIYMEIGNVIHTTFHMLMVYVDGH